MPRSRLIFGAAVLAALTLGAAGCGSSAGPRVSTKTSGGNNTIAYAASPADLAALPAAFLSYTMLTNCQVAVVAGTARFARVASTGDAWAIADIAPTAQCHLTSGPGGITLTPAQSPYFGASPVSIFERVQGGPWRMNDKATVPFPCPDPIGRRSGYDVPTVPENVLHAWGLNYAQGCENVIQPRLPGH